MKLVVGLGNPGRKYQGTRHNVGFVTLDLVARRNAADPPKNNFEALVAPVTLGGHKSLLVWPQTYMNLSGQSVLVVRDFYKIDSADILVVADDFHLPLGKLRVRAAGSAGGQKGLANILTRLGTEAIARLRIGIGSPPPHMAPMDYVLGRFARAEEPQIDAAIERAAEAVELWAERGIQPCMNRFNAASAAQD